MNDKERVTHTGVYAIKENLRNCMMFRID